METIVNSAEDHLIDSLGFKIEPAASYVQDRKSCTFWSVGSNAYSPAGGVKLIKFVLNGDDGMECGFDGHCGTHGILA